jgi:DNA-binding MarR family transcriptional regulator
MRTVHARTDSPAPAPGPRAEAGYRAALLIREIHGRLTARVEAELAGTGLTLPQITLIKAVAHAGEPTVTELARAMGAAKSTVTGIVDRLEAAGLLERRRSAEDRREVRVAFAPGGASRLRRIRGAVDDCFAAAFGPLSDAELERLGLSLGTILGALGPATGE